MAPTRKRVAWIGGAVALFMTLSLLGQHGSPRASSSTQAGSDNGFLHICSWSHYDASTNRCLEDETTWSDDFTAVFSWSNTQPILVDAQVQDGAGHRIMQGVGHDEVDSGDALTQGDNKVQDLMDSAGVDWSSSGPVRFIAWDTSGHRLGSYVLNLS